MQVKVNGTLLRFPTTIRTCCRHRRKLPPMSTARRYSSTRHRIARDRSPCVRPWHSGLCAPAADLTACRRLHSYTDVGVFVFKTPRRG